MIALSVSAFALRYAFSFVADGARSLMRGIRSTIFWLSAEGRALAMNRASMILSGIKSKALAFWHGVVATKVKIATLWTNRYALAQKAGAIASGIFAFGLKGIQTALNLVKIGVRSLIGATGIGLLFVAAGLIYEYWTPIKAFFSNLWDGIYQKAKPVFDWISDKMSGIGKIAGSIAGFFGFGGDDEESGSANNTKYKPGATVKKLATATALSTQLVASSPQAMMPLPTQQQGQIQQTNHIKVIVNNPSSNVDIEKAIKEAMKKQGNDRSLSDSYM